MKYAKNERLEELELGQVRDLSFEQNQIRLTLRIETDHIYRPFHGWIGCQTGQNNLRMLDMFPQVLTKLLS